MDDLIVSLIDINSKSFLYIVYNASRKNEDEKIFFKCAPNAEILHVKNCLFAIQGPESIEVLNNVIELPVDMHFLDIDVFLRAAEILFETANHFKDLDFNDFDYLDYIFLIIYFLNLWFDLLIEFFLSLS